MATVHALCCNKHGSHRTKTCSVHLRHTTKPLLATCTGWTGLVNHSVRLELCMVDGAQMGWLHHTTADQRLHRMRQAVSCSKQHYATTRQCQFGKLPLWLRETGQANADHPTSSGHLYHCVHCFSTHQQRRQSLERSQLKGTHRATAAMRRTFCNTLRLLMHTSSVLLQLLRLQFCRCTWCGRQVL